MISSILWLPTWSKEPTNGSVTLFCIIIPIFVFEKINLGIFLDWIFPLKVILLSKIRPGEEKYSSLLQVPTNI